MGSKEIIEYIETDKRLLRPCNYPIGTPGNGYGIFQLGNGEIIVVINVMCRLFMDSLDDPFKSVSDILDQLQINTQIQLFSWMFMENQPQKKWPLVIFLMVKQLRL